VTQLAVDEVATLEAQLEEERNRRKELEDGVHELKEVCKVSM
jgi:hypothetical protein